MKTLYLRIYATLVVVLLLFALIAGWLFSRNVEHRRIEGEVEMSERVSAWSDLAQANLPPGTAPAEQQRQSMMEWSSRLGLAMALTDAGGKRIATSKSFEEEEARWRGGGRIPGTVQLPLADGRVLSVLMRPPPRMNGPWRAGPSERAASRPGVGKPGQDDDRGFQRPPFAGQGGFDERGGGPRGPGDERRGGGPGPGVFGFGGPGFGPPRDHDHDHDHGPGGRGPRPGPPSPWWFASTGNLVAAFIVLFVAVAAGAWPVVRRLTRRLESLKQGVEAFGAGALDRRVPVDGSDEVAALAISFNRAASQVEALVRSHQSLLANASHELRSPLARMKMAVSLMDSAPAEQRQKFKTEIDTNIAELDSLVEEVLLASRLDASGSIERTDEVDLLALAAEEAGRTGAAAEGESVTFHGNERLLRRALRNLLENAKRYGGGDVVAEVKAEGGRVWMRVCDRGPGVPEELRERIFEPFYRLPGHAEQAGGVGLGLNLVRQIAERHGGSVHWEPRAGGGSCFIISMPRK